jgi:hypothetical protein
MTHIHVENTCTCSARLRPLASRMFNPRIDCRPPAEAQDWMLRRVIEVGEISAACRRANITAQWLICSEH